MKPISLRHLLAAVNIAVIGLVLIAIAAVPSGPFVAVVMPPGTSAEATAAAVAMAGGRLVSSARVDWIVIAQSGDGAFASKLRRSGAWLLLNPKVISICGPRAI
jgi:hypothetical protein